jgi:hypothetical protein
MMIDEIIAKGYKKPEIVAFNESPRLTDVGILLAEDLHHVAREISRLRGFTRDERDTHSIPSALAAMLNAFDKSAAIMAATAYLETRGFIVTFNRKED